MLLHSIHEPTPVGILHFVKIIHILLFFLMALLIGFVTALLNDRYFDFGQDLPHILVLHITIGSVTIRSENTDLLATDTEYAAGGRSARGKTLAII